MSAVFWYWQHSATAQQIEAHQRFEQLTRYAAQAFKNRLHSYESIAYASSGALEGYDAVSADKWHAFYQFHNLRQDYPEVTNVAFARYRQSSNLFVFQMQGEENTGANTNPIREHGSVVELIQLESAEQQPGTPGIDVTAEPKTFQALVESVARRVPVISGHTEDHSRGSKIIRQVMPVFRRDHPQDTEEQRNAALRGWLMIDYDIQRWLAKYKADMAQADWRVSITEQEQAAHLFGNTGADVLQRTYSVEFGGRHWKMHFTSTPEFMRRYSSRGRHLFSLVMLSLLFLLWWVFRKRYRERDPTMAMALSMTIQADSEERYRQLFEANQAVELLIDPTDGSIIDANPAAVDFYGYSRNKLQSMNISDINILSPDEVAAEVEQARNERRAYYLFKHRLASGQVRDVEVHTGPIKVAGKPLLYSVIYDVTARLESERALRESEARYRTIINTTAEGYWLMGVPSLRIIEVNDAICNMLGYSREELIGQQPLNLADEENRKIFEHQSSGINRDAQRHYEVVLKHKDGHDIAVSVHETNMPNDKQETRQAFAFITDISERKQIEEQLRIAATFYETTSEAITVTDMNNRIIAVNPAFCMITGYSEEEVLGKDPSFLSSGRNDKAFYHNMWQTLERMGRWQGEIWNRRKNGEVFPEWLSIVAIKDENGNTKQYMAVFSDITKRKQDEEKIWRQANYDGLTGLPNRNLFKDRLVQAMHTTRREGNRLALLFIDLDRFKWVNDTLGHAAGDLLLQETARRLTHCVRETDTVARLGGDEFTIILGDVRDSSEVDRIGEKLLKSLAEPFKLDGKEAFVSGSIGITFYPTDADKMEQLLRNADAAMYSAKEAGRNVFRYFTHELNAEAKRRLQLEADLRRVIERGELTLAYQPIVTSSGRTAGAEALLRWHHPEYGFVSPEEFIPLAEEIGVIIDIEQWVMRQACHDASHFQQSAGDHFFMSVNISSMQCKSDQCRLFLGATLQESGIAPNSLKLEITERVMMENTAYVIALLSEVKTMGVRLAVDDFGTGYSSLSYLKQFPVDVLKIDRTFIAGLPEDKDDVALVEAIVAMAHSLNLQVVAEGVETAEQLAFLRNLGCDLIQGYYFSKPLPPTQFESYLTHH